MKVNNNRTSLYCGSPCFRIVLCCALSQKNIYKKCKHFFCNLFSELFLFIAKEVIEIRNINNRTSLYCGSLVFVLCCIVPHPKPNPNPNPNLRKNLLGGQSSREAILQGGNFSVTVLRDSLSKPKYLSEGNRYFQTVYCLAYIT